MQYALPIDYISEADISAAIAELDQRAAELARDDYFFAGPLGFYVYVWFDGKIPIYVGEGHPNKPERYLEHWTKAGSKDEMELSWYFLAHKTTIWPAFAASNLAEGTAYSLERLLIRTYRRRIDGGTLFNLSLGKSSDRLARGDDTFSRKQGVERAPVSESYLAKFQRSNRPLACWQTALAHGVVIPDECKITILVNDNPKAASKKGKPKKAKGGLQFALYSSVETVGEYRSVCAKHKIGTVEGDLLWDSCCQHPEGPYIAFSPPIERQCIFGCDHQQRLELPQADIVRVDGHA